MDGPFDPRRWVYESDPQATPKQVRFSGPPSAVIDTDNLGHNPRHTVLPKNRAKLSAETTVAAVASTQTPIRTVLYGALIAGVLFSLILGRLLPPKGSNDEVSPAVKAYIDRALNKALRDPVGRRDFALFANGGRVLYDLTDIGTREDFSTCLSPASIDLSHSDASGTAIEAIMDDLRIGQCWTISGHVAQLGLRVSQLMHPTHVTVDHIPIEIASDIGHAPRVMILWGAIDGANTGKMNEDDFTRAVHIAPSALLDRRTPRITCGHTYTLLASFEYDIRAASHIQTFPLARYVMDLDLYFGVFVLEILDNWGSNSTCLYRVRIHGDPLD